MWHPADLPEGYHAAPRGQAWQPSAGQVAQRSATTPAQQSLLRALDLPEPPKFFDFTITDND